MTFTSTPKSSSFFSIRREVNASVSVPITATACSDSSSSLMGGSSESGSSSNNGTCFSRSTRADFGICSAGGSMRIGAWISNFFLPTSTTSSRSITAAAPARRSCQSLERCLMNPYAPSSQAPRRSRKATHEIPVNRLNPIAISTSNTSVAPVKPMVFNNKLLMPAPSMPPGASGNVIFRL